jgi:polysaccharide pyruvyl transferase WcaK-like protein
MKCLVTGLCLSQNLGGPAMALTLVGQIKKRLSAAEFIFAVDSASFDQERKWANFYGLRICHWDNFISHFFATNAIFRVGRFLYRMVRVKPCDPLPHWNYEELHKEFMEAYDDCDVVISMRGISYIGDGTKGIFEGPLSYSDLHYAKKKKKPFTHFIQSFGPFNDWKVRYFARRDFAYVDFIPARGKESAKHCQQIVAPPEKVYDFPDIAILLPMTDDQWTLECLDRMGLREGKYIILSPSSVIYNLPPNVSGSIGEKHVQSYYLIARELLSRGEDLLFLAHMYSDDKRQCDREISRKIMQYLKINKYDISRCKIIEEDINPWQAKALIAKSRYTITSRYHAIVAAVSASIPVVAVGWNVKYHDIMDYYGISSMTIDVRDKAPEEIANSVFKKIKAYEDQDYKSLLKEKHEENVKRVEVAFDLLSEWIKNNVNTSRN